MSRPQGLLEGKSKSQSPPSMGRGESSAESERLSTSSRIESSDTSVSPAVADSTQDNLPHVLVVDDNAINLHLLVAFIRRTKHPFDSAQNGLQALEMYKRSALEDDGVGRFKHILMDISMPVMDGISAAKEIRKFEKENRIEAPVKIIALTGLGEQDAYGYTSEAGFDRWLSKPVVSFEAQSWGANGLTNGCA